NPDEEDREVAVDIKPVLLANHSDTLMRATLDGAGISAQPLDLVANYLRDGQLRRVLAPSRVARIRVSLWLASSTGLMSTATSRSSSSGLISCHSRWRSPAWLSRSMACFCRSSGWRGVPALRR
ncbi:MAG: hypothetical protein EOO54_28155, partial [Haliea sp.]